MKALLDHFSCQPTSAHFSQIPDNFAQLANNLFFNLILLVTQQIKISLKKIYIILSNAGLLHLDLNFAATYAVKLE